MGIIEGILEVKLPTTWTDEKAEVERVREEKRREEEGRSDKRKSQKKEDASARKRRKVAQHLAPEGRKVGSLKWANERWKIARRCGAKQISKSKCTKHLNVAALLEVEISKKCAP